MLLSTSPAVKDEQPEVNRIRRSFELGDGDTAFVGRTSKTHKDRQAGPSNAFFDGSTVSREHGYLRNRNGTLMYADTCSRMGTRINDKPVTEANVETELSPGDVIALAAHKRTSSLVEFKVYFSENKAELPTMASVPVPLRVLTPESSNNSSGVVQGDEGEHADAGESSGSGSTGESHGEQILDERQVHASVSGAYASSPVFVPYDAQAADAIEIDDDSDDDDDDYDVELSSDDSDLESEDDLVDSDEDLDEDFDEDADLIEVDTTIDTGLGFGDSYVALSDSDGDSENDDDYIDSNREDCDCDDYDCENCEDSEDSEDSEDCEEYGYYEIGDGLVDSASDSAGSPDTISHESVPASPPPSYKNPDADAKASSAEVITSDPKPTTAAASSTKMQNAHAITAETSSTSCQGGAWVVCHASADTCMEASQPSEAPTPAQFAVASAPGSSTPSVSTNSGTNNSTKRKRSDDDDPAAATATPRPQKRARSSVARTAAKELAKGLAWSIVGGVITFAALAAYAPPEL